MKYVYRVLTAIAAAAIFPVFLFAPLLRLVYSVILTGESELTLSLKDMLFSGGNQLQTEKLLSLDAVQPLKPAVTALCILLSLSLAAALVIVIFSLCSDRYAITTGLSGVGTALLLCALIPMHSISTMLTDGTVSIGTLLSQLQETGAANTGILSLLQSAPSIADLAVQIKSVGFGAAYYGSLLLMILLMIWSIAHVVISIGENKKPPRRTVHQKKK
ncbi:MAG: hypothetical protein KIC46_05740 [Clostridiales bacterium]|nr:hypothetical protein [Clostridiales bacterium]